ncbi:MAG: hypothetical protein WCF46_10870, partial [Nitrososphaeraceae archaeon]
MSSDLNPESGYMKEIGIGEYSVTEMPPDPQFDILYSSDCTGTMRQGETRICIITNMYRNLIVTWEFEVNCQG